jgi:serine/threonine-protein kinase
MPRVIDLPCQQAKQALEGQGFPVTMAINPNAVVRIQLPGENSQVAPGTPVTLTCF